MLNQRRRCAGTPADAAIIIGTRTRSRPSSFFEGHPPGIRSAAERLCALVTRADPDAIEGVRPGWRLIGYDVPIGKRTRYFAFAAPEVEHVHHLGFETAPG